MSEAASLRALAEALGIATSHLEIGGQQREVPEQTLRAIIVALGHSRTTLAALEARQEGELAPAVVPSFAPAAPRIALSGCVARGVDWTIEGEGLELAGRAKADELECANDRVMLGLPPLAPGYYRLRLEAGARRADVFFIRAPARAWLPPALDHGRGYGLSVQLYELVGDDSLGMGDFGDLAALAEAAGRMGASSLGVNPLHALFLSDPARVSPYSPSSRLALNPLYLQVPALPGFEVRARAQLRSPACRARVMALNAQALVDYPAAAREKLSLARLAFEDFCKAGDDEDFARFCHAASGAAVWARHEAIAVEHGADWRAWPAGFHAVNGAAVERHLAEHADRVAFHLWLQWQAERQLQRAASRARAAGMGVGLYRDLALGADPGGAECWAGQANYASGLGVGAPPDPFNPRGQNWGFPPLDPRALVGNDFANFIALIRENMRNAGALRIDHVLGLKRLFVIPDGVDPEAGAYLRYPFEALLAIVVLESVRAKCLVIGEDLGTVPQGLREKLERHGIFSLRVLYFEHDHQGRPRPPEVWPRDAIACVGTHDMAPLAGWWQGEDLARMERLGLWPDEASSKSAKRGRETDRNALAAALHTADTEVREGEASAAAAYGRLARTPSRLAMIQPEDTLGIQAPVNVPGTTDEEPNWRRRRLPPWPEWLADPRFVKVVRSMQCERGRPPLRQQAALIGTYRLQLNREFDFRAAARRAPYIARLGASHLYLSPVMMAAPGSTHGYDMVDPARLDVERGGEAGFAQLLAACSQSGLGLIADFVPNHMGANGANPWWWDLLEWGLASRYVWAFDVDWAAAADRVVLPLLGMSLARSIAQGEVELDFDRAGGFVVSYYEHRFPLAPTSMGPLLEQAAREVKSDSARNELLGLAKSARTLGQHSQADRRASGLLLKARLATLAEEGEIDSVLARLATGMAVDRSRFARLLARQNWRLVYWRRGLEEVNYRRFFDVSSLAGMRNERPAVFGAAHVRIRALVAAHALEGLRLDHVDGLAAPTQYLEALAQLVAANGGGVPLWVEKILAVDEALPDWPVAGTTGYDFLNDVTRLFMSASGARQLRAIWREYAPNPRSFATTVTHSKRSAVRNLLAPALARVTAALAPHAPVSRRILRAALVEALVALPVYRAYPRLRTPPSAAERGYLARMVEAAARVDRVAADWLAELFERSLSKAPLPADLENGVMRLWQLAAAAMAKGLEDTAFYRDFALLALNEVGGDPRVAAFSAECFHQRMQLRLRDWPQALSASATHDSKRGEDARLRLAMLSHRAQQWRDLLPRLQSETRKLATGMVHPADKYLLWQTLAAILPPQGIGDRETRKTLAKRLCEYLLKALREGKQRTSWLAPHEDYEARVCAYANALFDPDLGEGFQREFLPFAHKLARDGALASLAALVLKCMAPGVPDFYQGSEFWDLSLVDPDNRRAVDYARRERALDQLRPWIEGRTDARAELVEELLEAWPDGRIKLYVLASLLRLRRKNAALFARGSYQPLTIEGAGANAALALRRAYRDDEIVVVIARVGPELMDADRCALAAAAWGDARITGQQPRQWRELLCGRRLAGDEFRLAELLSPLPAAVLIAQAD